MSWNLPGAGAFVYAFAKGLLQLELPIDGLIVRPARVIVWGSTLFKGAEQQRVRVPAWAVARWPVELRSGFSIEITGLNVGGDALNLHCDTWSCVHELEKRAWAAQSMPGLCCTLDDTTFV